MSSGKIRITVPIFIKNMLDSDIDEFLSNKNHILNQIYKNKAELNFIYNGKSAEKNLFLNSTETTLIQFELTKENNSDFYAEKIKLMRSFKRFKIADYFRQLLLCYINLVKFKREIIIYRDKVDVLCEVIQKEKKIELTVRKKSFIYEPYFIANLEIENRNYLCGYSEYSNDYRNFRISSIENIVPLDRTIENKDKEYIDLLKNNFDPFFSAGKKVKVRLTENGKKRYERIISNRPKLLEREEEDIWVFEASEFKAELYFSGFLDDAEILEPLSLKDKIRVRLENALQKYV